MRRILILFCCILLVCLFAFPAFASGGSSGSSTRLYQNTLQFDSLCFDVGSQSYALDFPFNYGYNGGRGDFSFEDGLVYGSQILSSVSGYNSYPVSTGSLYMPLLSPSVGSADTLTLKGGEQVIHKNNVSDFVISVNPAKMQLNVVTVYGGYYTVEYNSIDSSVYTAKSVPFSFEVPVVNGRAQIGDSIKSFFNGLDSSKVYWGLSSLSIALNFTRLDVDTTLFTFSSTFKGQGDLVNLVSSLSIRTPDFVSTSFDATEWLASTVGSFLEFELFPGFSINTIFTIVLTIGILLWFISVIK